MIFSKDRSASQDLSF